MNLSVLFYYIKAGSLSDEETPAAAAPVVLVAESD